MTSVDSPESHQPEPPADSLQAAIQHHRAGRRDRAVAIYQAILSRQPDHPDALNLLGVAASQNGKYDAALDLIGRAVALNPAAAVYHCNLGQVLAAMGRTDQAIAAYRRSLQLNADLPQAHYNLGNALRASGKPADAVEAYQRAVKLRQNYFDAHNNLGATFLEANELEQAAAANRQALTISPESAAAHFNLGLSLLAHGDLAEGWEHYDWRRRLPELDAGCQQFSQPQWRGELLNGRTIFLHHEQGLGDSIQFVRYLPLVAQRGRKVILQSQPELSRLFGQIPGIEQIVPTGQLPLPRFDAQCSLVSLPLAFGTTIETIPATVPYLRADDEAASRWRERIADAPERLLKVGLVWAGKPTKKNDHLRSLPLGAFAALAKIEGVRWFSLQKGAAAHAAREQPQILNLVDHTSELHDFAETAALVANLDLVISVDTATAHLAGAMGKRVWVLLPFVPDWRWMLDRTDSPWYPTMRLFRQTHPGDWSAPLGEVAEALRELARQMSRS